MNKEKPTRPRQIDGSRNLTKVDNWDDFCKIDWHVENFEADINGKKKENPSKIHSAESKKEQSTSTHSKLNGSADEKKNNIIIPQVRKLDGGGNAQAAPASTNTGTVNREKVTTNGIIERDVVQKKRKINLEYFKIMKKDVLPKNDIYEANSDDMVFIKEFNRKHEEINMKLTHEAFEKIITTWELVNENQNLLVNISSARNAILNKGIDATVMQKLEDIHDHWKKKREMLKRPLLRKLWKPASDETNPYVAFRPREREKMKLRRGNKISDNEGLQKLKSFKSELEFVRNLIEQIKMRERLKLELSETSIYKLEDVKTDRSDHKEVLDKLNKTIGDVKRLLTKSYKTFPLEQKKIENTGIKKSMSQPPTKIQVPAIIPEPEPNNNFDATCLVVSLYLEGLEKNLSYDDVVNTTIVHKKKIKRQPPVETDRLPAEIPKPLMIPPIVPIENPQSGNTMPMQPFPPKNLIKKNIIQYKIRKIISRKRPWIHRFFEQDDFKLNMNFFNVDTKLKETNEILKKRNTRFQQINDNLESFEELNEDEVKALKKQIQNGLKSFNKMKKSQLTQFH